MEVRILSTYNDSILKEFRKSLKWAKEVKICVAYATYSAFELLKDEILQFFKNNGSMKTIFDIEKYITEKKIIEELATIPGDSRCKVFFADLNSNQEFGNFHPKLYIFYDDTKYNIIAGSSNFTIGGLKSNLEFNLCINGIKDDFFYNVLQYFDNIWSSKYAIDILDHSDILDNYQNIKNIYDSKQIIAKEDRNIEKFHNKVKNIISSKKDFNNEYFAYFLGLLSANSEVDINNRTIKIHLDRGVVNKGTEYSGIYYFPEITDYSITQKDAHERDSKNIVATLKEMLRNYNDTSNVNYEYNGNNKYTINIILEKNSVVYKKLLEYDFYNYTNRQNRIISFIPKEIKSTNDVKLIRAFIRGYFDLKARISPSDGIYKKVNGKRVYSCLRVGISIPNKLPNLVYEFLELFNKIGLHDGINYTNPKKRSKREFLIRIDVRVLPKELISTHWKKIFISEFINYLNT
ncbi:phospholipase D-like domain-containing protein [Caloranaerobacter sp. DY30410]|uniref:phospholipase D-like domain-containing protein n=1 Tax=Caloranaerobacter sp. DY30410 TaxID=3238305 RepID=UPI003D075384